MEVRTIFGPPGTGKTATMVEFAEKEGEGLYLSYTRAAAAEALSRVGTKAIRPSTLHSLSFNALGMNRAAVVDKEKLVRFARETGIPFKGEDGTDEEQEGDQYLAVLQFANNRLMADRNEAFDHFGCPGTRARWEAFVQQYEQWKQTFGYMDFDDMLIKYSRDGRSTAKVVFLDEAQDCTPLQWRAFERAIENARRVYLAGDDDQAIYEWSGADPHAMINFTERHAGKQRVLEKSYRLTEPVHLQALGLIEQIEKRVAKKFQPRGPGEEILGYRDLEFVTGQLEKFAPDGAMILTRDRFKQDDVKKALNRELVPYDVLGGFSPWTGKLAKAIKAGDKPEIPVIWRDFYKQADLSMPIKYTLSTIHQAKGREHDTVIMDLDCPPRVLRNLDLDRDAEIRVQYVGVTRAKQRLILCGGNPLL